MRAWSFAIPALGEVAAYTRMMAEIDIMCEEVGKLAMLNADAPEAEMHLNWVACSKRQGMSQENPEISVGHPSSPEGRPQEGDCQHGVWPVRVTWQDHGEEAQRRSGSRGHAPPRLPGLGPQVKQGVVPQNGRWSGVGSRPYDVGFAERTPTHRVCAKRAHGTWKTSAEAQDTALAANPDDAEAPVVATGAGRQCSLGQGAATKRHMEHTLVGCGTS